MEGDPADLGAQLVELPLQVGHRRQPELELLLDRIETGVVGGAPVVDRLRQRRDLFFHGRHLLRCFRVVAGLLVERIQDA